MFDLFGSELPLAARFFIAFLVVLALIGLTAWVVRRFGANRLGASGARGRQPRLAVIDAASVDGRRRLVLIRRDNVEHLLMIGGPTDVVVEPNIVRAAAAREPARMAVPGEPSLRAAPAPETAWPLQPVNEPPPVAPPRPHRAPERGMPPEETQAPRAPVSEEPWLPQEPGARARPADSLSGLAAELSSKLTPPEVAEPRTAAAEPPPEPAPAGSHNLSEMAQQLEAALRRAPMTEARPPVTDPLATQAHAPQGRAPASEPAPHAPQPRMSEARAPEPRVEARPAARPAPRAEYKAQPKLEPKFEPKFEPKTEPKTEPKFEPKFEPKTELKPEPKFEPKAEAEPKAEPKAEPPAKPDFATDKNLTDKNLYDNLEEEMASLLGRPSGKS